METKTKVKANEEVVESNNGIEVYNKENVLNDKEKSKQKIVLIISIIIFIIIFLIIFLSVYLTKGKEEENKEDGNDKEVKCANYFLPDDNEKEKICCNLDNYSECYETKDSIKCKECNLPYQAINGICELKYGLIEAKFKVTNENEEVRLIGTKGNYLIKKIKIDGENMADLSLENEYYYYKNPSSLREYKASIVIDLENCDSLEYMFYQASNLIEISFINFDTRNIKDMQYMFGLCKSLTSLNLSSFNTQNVQSMSGDAVL